MANKSIIDQENIINGFNKLRADQRTIAIKLSELESDIKEHEIVIEALKIVEPGRKCFRQIGGVLVERTVGDVLPALTEHKDNIQKLVTKLTEQLEEKGKEIFEYQTAHKLQLSMPKDNHALSAPKPLSTQS